MYQNDTQNASGFDVAHWGPYLSWAEHLGLALLPVRTDEFKKPAIKWKEGSSFKRADWHAWLAEGRMLAIDAAKSGLILIDIDIKRVGRDPAWTVYHEYMASLGAAALAPYCESASGGWHVAVRRPEGIDPEHLRGLLQPRMTSDARPLMEGEKDSEIVSLRNRGYCVMPGSTFGGKHFYKFMSELPEPHECAALAEALRRSTKIEYHGTGKGGDSDCGDVAELVAFLDKHGEFDTRDDRYTGLCAIKTALGNTDEALEVAREILHPDTPEEKFFSTWNEIATVPDAKPGVKLYTIGSMIWRAKELGWKGHVGRSLKTMFKDVVAEIATSAGAKLAPTSGGVPLMQGQIAVLDLGRSIVDAFIAANSGNNPAGDAPKLPDEISDYGLYNDGNAAIGLAVAQAERSPRAFRADDVIDVLAVIEAIHADTYKAVVARIRGTRCSLPEGKLIVAVNRFRAAIMRACRTAGGWRTDGKGLPEAKNADNVAALLDHVRVTVKFNQWTQRVDVAWPGEELRKFQDHDLHELRRTGSADYEYNPDKTLLRDTIDAISRKQAYDPVLDKINSLVWDGVPRLTTWLSIVCHVPLDAYHAAVGKILIGGIVKRARHPGVKHDFVPVLTGPQRKGKSTLCEILATDVDWFLENLDMDARPQDFIPQMAGKLVIELAEFDGITGKKASAHLKAFISTKNDNFTRKYNAYASDQRRRCVFIATANDFKPLVDATGNTRYFPVQCDRPLDLEWLRANVEQLIAEAAHLEVQGEPFALPPGLYQVATARQEGARSQPDYEVLLRRWFAPEEPEGVPPEIAKLMRQPEFVITADIYKMLRDELRRQVYPNAVAAVMRDLGFVPDDQKIKGRKEAIWRRGKWTAGGAGMWQHKLLVVPGGGQKFGRERIPTGFEGMRPPPPPSPR